jgi:hypothetical protein
MSTPMQVSEKAPSKPKAYKPARMLICPNTSTSIRIGMPVARRIE